MKFNQLVQGKNGLVLYNKNDQYIGRSLATYGEFSELEADIFKQICKKSDTVIEVGANIGTHTQIFSQLVGVDGKVLAFEPQRVVFQTLCANIALNSFTNVFTYQYALGKEEGYVSIPLLDYHKHNNFGGISIQNRSHGEQVKKVKIDTFIEQCQKLQLIKIDVEGMESDVIKGATKIIEKYHPIIYVENDRIEKSQELIELIQSYGYNLYWHLPPLFNQNNFKKQKKNIFGNIISVNMLCIHKDHKTNIENLVKIDDPTFHPMKRKKMQKKELQSLFIQAHELYKKQDLEKAKEIYEKILKIDSNNSEALCNLGVIQRKLGDNKAAYDCYVKAINTNPQYSLSYLNLGNLLKDTRNYEAALKVYSDAIKIDPKNHNAYNSLGMVYERIGQDNKAIQSYKMAVKVNPKFAKAINNIGVVLYNQKKYDQAIEIFKIALKTDPDYHEMYSNIGACFNKLKMYDKAIENLDKAIELDSKNGGAYTNLGNVYNKLHEYKKAATLHEKSIELIPNGANAYSNVGTSYKNMGQVQKAIKSYQKAIELKPDFENAHFDLATMYLAKGELDKGFAEYEWRFRKDEMKSHIFKHKEIYTKQRFSGNEEIKNKKLLVHTEQGFGDSIQFVRFVPLLKEKYNCEVILQCRDELKTLFENSIQNVDHFYAREADTLPEFDYQIAMLSLPFLFKVKTFDDIPKSFPYLTANDDKELIIEKQKGKIDIGICWSASVTGESYEGKVFDITMLEPLIKHPKINIYSLQVGPEKEDIKNAGYEEEIIDLSDKLTDFSKTASLMKQLDLTISSDTSVAHLAAALDLPVWIPLQKYPDWRWTNKGETTPWYNSAKLFRQKSPRVWEGVFQSIFAKLSKQYKMKIK